MSNVPVPGASPRRRRVTNIHWVAAYLFAALGVGAAIHGGLRWRELPTYSERDIEQSAALNLAVDQQRRGAPAVVTADQQAEQLEQEKQEVRSDIQQERTWIRAELGFGLVLIVMAVGQATAGWLSNRARARG